MTTSTFSFVEWSWLGVYCDYSARISSGGHFFFASKYLRILEIFLI